MTQLVFVPNPKVLLRMHHVDSEHLMHVVGNCDCVTAKHSESRAINILVSFSLGPQDSTS